MTYINMLDLQIPLKAIKYDNAWICPTCKKILVPDTAIDIPDVCKCGQKIADMKGEIRMKILGISCGRKNGNSDSKSGSLWCDWSCCHCYRWWIYVHEEEIKERALKPILSGLGKTIEDVKVNLLGVALKLVKFEI